MVRRWLDSWAGLGAIVVGMRRLGYDLWLRYSLTMESSGLTAASATDERSAVDAPLG